MKPFRTIAAEDLDSVSLKSEMETYGYVFIRDLMPKEDLGAAPQRYDLHRIG